MDSAGESSGQFRLPTIIHGKYLHEETIATTSFEGTHIIVKLHERARTHAICVKASMMEEKNEVVNGKMKIFVAGASGSTGKRIVEQLLAKGFAVKAGVRDLDKAKSTFTENPNLQNFLMRLMGDESEVNLANGETKAEFSEWKWATPEEVIEQAVDYKRPTYLSASLQLRKSCRVQSVERIHIN